MFDRNNYVKEKIMNKLKQSEDYDISFNDSVSKLLDSVNVGIMPERSEVFEENVISWINFCNIVVDLIKNKLEISLENFKNKFLISSDNKKNEQVVERMPEVISQEHFVEATTEEKMQRLLNIAEDVSMFFDFEVDFLTEEGLRQRGLVSENSTSLDGEEINGEVKPNIPILKLKKGEQIVSPFTGSTEVCQVENFLWMDIDTEETFMVYFS